jgi:hypothetical protein
MNHQLCYYYNICKFFYAIMNKVLQLHLIIIILKQIDSHLFPTPCICCCFEKYRKDYAGNLHLPWPPPWSGGQALLLAACGT